MAKEINIDLNRKIISHSIINQIRDTAKSQEMIAGSAILSVIDDMDKLRYICEGVITAYERNNEEKVRKGLEVLRMIL